MRASVWTAVVAGLVLTSSPVSGQVTKESVPGISNFSRVGTTIACAGATTPAAVAAVKQMGYRAIVNLRQPAEAGANIAEEQAAAAAAGIRYISLPFNAANPDPMLVDGFLAAVADPGNQPVFVHCASANRAAALWLIKRLLVDGWDAERATAEAAALGLTSGALKAFALDYVAAHPKK